MLVYECHRHGISLDTLRDRHVHLCDSLPALPACAIALLKKEPPLWLSPAIAAIAQEGQRA
jgi:hypothetical protein